MSTSAELPNGNHDSILKPRPFKPGNPGVIRAQSQEETLKVETNGNGHASAVSSGRSTPVPDDAPPSAVATSSARKHLRAQRNRIFPSIEYEARVSHFDPRSEYRDFRGFFVLFWVGLAIMVITTGLRNVKDTGYPLRNQMWGLMTVKAWQLGLSDAAMVLSAVAAVPFQQLMQRSNGWLRWTRAGMPILSTFEVLWLLLWVNWPFLLDWTWTAQVFFTLHLIVILMKMHSYSFYNGHLSNTQKRLHALDKPGKASRAAVVRYPSFSKPADTYGGNDEKKEIQSLSQLRADLAIELTSPLGSVTYPSNLTYANYADYILCPTLCYEMEYPRTEKRRWDELGWKTAAVAGCIFLLTLISEEFIVPVLQQSAIRLSSTSRWSDQVLILAENISELLFPFMVTLLLVFLVIFEYVLGAFAEITRFADRHFYSDWWNSCDWLEFSREWNLPVYHFLHRHVYLASRPYVSKSVATLITFLVSAAGHELVMGCITKKLRGYGFIAQMLQLPIVMVQRSPFIRGKKLLNKIVASSFLTNRYASATDQLQSLYTALPPNLRAYLTSALDLVLPHHQQKAVPPLSVLEKLTEAYTNSSNSTLLLGIFAPLLLLIYSLMSWWPTSGRYSPFSNLYNRSAPPQVTEEDYHYLSGESDHRYSPSNSTSHYHPHQPHHIPIPQQQQHYRGNSSSSAHRPSSPPTREVAPDKINLRHKGIVYILHFPAFSISEEKLKVRDLRKSAASALRVDDPSRIKLLYKGKQLRDSAATCRHENLKQNSEVMCVVSNEPASDDDDDEDSYDSRNGEDEDSVVSTANNSIDGTRDDGAGSGGRKKKRKNHRSKKPKSSVPSSTSVPLTDASTHINLAPPPIPNSTNSSSRNASPAPVKLPSSPAEILSTLENLFDTQFLPLVHSYLGNPPTEPKAREYEYKKLSETILTQVLLKLDGVDTGGEEGLRARRKELVKRIQGWLGELDKVGKPRA